MTEKQNETIIPNKFSKIIEDIEKMSVLDLAELVKVLEERFSISATMPMMMTAPASTTTKESVEEKSSFNVELKGVGDKKIEVIKIVRDVTGKGLKEAKDLVDAAASSPQMIATEVKKEEAEEIKKKFLAVGASIELK